MPDIIHHGSLTIFKPDDTMTIETAVEVQTTLEALLRTKGVRDLVIDLGTVTHVDGSGMGALVAAATMARSSGTEFFLYRPTQEVQSLLTAINIAGFFPILEYEEDLLAHLPD